MKITNKILIITGSKITIQEYDRPIGYAFSVNQKPHVNKIIYEKLANPEESARKAKSALKRLIWCNGWQYFNPQTKKRFVPQFLTLTFAENIQDLKEANIIFKNFLKRLNYYVKNQK